MGGTRSRARLAEMNTEPNSEGARIVIVPEFLYKPLLVEEPMALDPLEPLGSE
jgi:hypothetical protein